MTTKLTTQRRRARAGAHPPGWFLVAVWAFLFGGVCAPQLAAQSCTLACNQNVNVSIGGVANNCAVEVTAGLLLGDFSTSCPGPKTVVIMGLDGQIIPNSPFIDASYLGQSLLYEVYDVNTNNYCPGTLTVEDKLAPQITDCGDQTFLCIVDPRPTFEGGDVPTPSFADCSSPGGVNLAFGYQDQLNDIGCDGGTTSAIITRTWTATDPNGFSSSCTQTLTFERLSLASNTPVCPANVDLECGTAGLDTDPSVTGYPQFEIGGVAYPIVPGANFLCELASSYTDETFPLCGGGTKILRTWTVYDWCLPTGSPNNPWSCIQVIKQEDNTAPVITCPATLNVSAVSSSCAATVLLPQATTSDVCSQVTVSVQTPQGLRAPGDFITLAAGTYNLAYVATDACGNSSNCLLKVNVVDDSPPTVVLDEFTTVSLNVDGTGLIAAQSFDDGSSDNCGIDRFEARRMVTSCAPAGSFDEIVYFSCCDIGSPVMVAVRVYDQSGNFNEGMVEVTVQDKIDPTIICPPDKQVSCLDDFSDLSVFGMPAAADNCSIASIGETVQDNRTACHTGTIVRTFTATDAGGRTVSCQQILTVVNPDVFDGPDSWPVDYTTDVCGADLDPANLPTAPINYSAPVITKNTCDNIAVTYTDQLLPIAGDACYKVLRKWIVIDWCQYDPNATGSTGYWEYTQILKVEDNDAPVLSGPDAEILVDNINADCGPVQVAIPLVTGTDCNPALTVSFTRDFGEDGSIESSGTGADASGSYATGRTRVTYTVSDGCGNASTYVTVIDVRDTKNPSPVCHNGLAVELMPMGNGGMIELQAEMFNKSSFDNCTAAADLEFEIQPSVFTCADVGTQQVTFFVTDEAGNTDFCETYVIIQDNMVLCPVSGQRIAGHVETEDGIGVDGVSVAVNTNGSSVPPFITGGTGLFSFDGLATGMDYSLTPGHTSADVRNGISTFDIVLIAKHILGEQYLDSPYKLIAADVNGSESITALDLVSLRKLILYLSDDFGPLPAWRFVDADHVFADPLDPWATPFPEVFNVNNLSADELNADFVAVKLGDANNSVKANLLHTPVEPRNAAPIHLDVTDQALQAGETTTVALDVADLASLAGLQFALAFDGLELLDWRSDHLTGAHLGTRLLSDGILTASWDKTKNNTHTTPTLLTLTFRATETGQLRDHLTLSARYTPAEAYTAATGTLQRRPLRLRYAAPTTPTSGLVLYQNRPNPFGTTTQIGFALPTAGAATLTVYDAAGRELYRHAGTYPAGLHTIDVRRAALAGSGVLYYRLRTATDTATRRMVVLD